MAFGKKISELPAATIVTGLELAVIVQDGETRKATIDEFNASVIAEASLKAYRTGDYLDAVQYIEFDTSTDVPVSVGRLSWNLDDGTLNLGLIGGNVVNQLGQELVQRVYNNTGAPIAEGAVVKVVGATGQRLTVELAQANSDENSITVIGVATETIADKALGYVATEGFVRAINTNGFTDGDVLWLSPTTPGQFTNVKPVAPQHSVMIGYVVKGGSVGAGSIFVKVQNGYEIGELHDVKVSTSTSLLNDEIITYNTSAGVWTNSTRLLDAFASISANRDAITSVVNTVSALEIRVSAVSARASAVAAAVVSTNNVVSALEIRVSAVSARASVNAAAITSTNNVVSALEIRVSAVSARASVNAAAITSVNNVVSALEIRVSAVSARASANAAAIVSVNNVVSVLELRVSAVSVAVSVLQQQVAALDVSAVNARLDTVSAAVSVNAAAITSVNAVFTALEIRVSNASAVGAANTLAITSVNAVVSTLTVRVNTVSARTSVNAAAITVVSNAVSALEIRVSTVSAVGTVVSAAITSVNAVVSTKVNRSGDTMTGNLTVPSLNSGPLAGFRNIIINGNFDVWQRGTSFASPANGSYVADRWRIDYTGTGATRTISRQAFTPGQTDVPGEPTYFLRFDQSVAGTGAAGNAITQRIEGVRTFAGQSITISFWAKAAASLTMPRVAMFQYFGLGGSPSVSTVTVAATNVAVGTTWAKYTYTIAMPSLSGKTIGTDGTDGIWLELRVPINTTFTFDLAQVQIELGPAATTFERRPLGTEQALCQRYYWKMTGTARMYLSGSTSNYRQLLIKHPVTMRTSPTNSGTSDSGTFTAGWKVDPDHSSVEVLGANSTDFLEVTSFAASAEL